MRYPVPMAAYPARRRADQDGVLDVATGTMIALASGWSRQQSSVKASINSVPRPRPSSSGSPMK